MLDNLRQDTRRLRLTKSKGFPWYVVESLLFENGYQAVVLHRLAHWFRRHGVPVVGPLLHRLSIFLTGVDVSPGATIGPGLLISHGVGLVVGDRVRIGRDCLLMHRVTLGAPTVERLGDMPTLGDEVVVGAGASIIGRVRVGDGALIGVHTVVTRDVPAGAKVLPPQSRVEPADAKPTA